MQRRTIWELQGPSVRNCAFNHVFTECMKDQLEDVHPLAEGGRKVGPSGSRWISSQPSSASIGSIVQIHGCQSRVLRRNQA